MSARREGFIGRFGLLRLIYTRYSRVTLIDRTLQKPKLRPCKREKKKIKEKAIAVLELLTTQNVQGRLCLDFFFFFFPRETTTVSA